MVSISNLKWSLLNCCRLDNDKHPQNSEEKNKRKRKTSWVELQLEEALKQNVGLDHKAQECKDMEEPNIRSWRGAALNTCSRRALARVFLFLFWWWWCSIYRVTIRCRGLWWWWSNIRKWGWGLLLTRVFTFGTIQTCYWGLSDIICWSFKGKIG